MSSIVNGRLRHIVLLAMVPACAGGHPLLQPKVREQLHQVESFSEPPVEPAEDGESGTLALPAEVLARIQGNASESGVATMSLGLPELRKHALENNLSLKIDLYEPAIAAQSYNIERAKFTAILGYGVNYASSHSADEKQSESVSMQPSISLPLHTGGTLALELPVTRVDTEVSEEVVIDLETGKSVPQGISYGAGLSFSLSQPLLRNAGLEHNLASIRTAQLSVRQADSRAKLAVIRLLATAERSYWNNFCANRDLEIQLKQYEASKEQVRIARRLVEEGVHTRVEITRARSGVASRFESIIRAETARRRTERELKRVMNLERLPVESDTTIKLESPPRLTKWKVDRAKVVELAKSNRMELFENEVQQAIDRIAIRTKENELWPDLNLDFRYSFSGEKPAFKDALSQLFDKSLNGYAVGVTFQAPLSSAAAKAKIRSAVLAAARTRINRRLIEQAIVKEVHDAIDNLEHNWQRILSNRLAVTLAGETYRAEKIQFQLGEVTSSEVLRALQSVSAAQSSEIQAVCDYQNAVVDLAFATGTVLGQSAVKWRAATIGN